MPMTCSDVVRIRPDVFSPKVACPILRSCLAEARPCVVIIVSTRLAPYLSYDIETYLPNPSSGSQVLHDWSIINASSSS